MTVIPAAVLSPAPNPPRVRIARWANVITPTIVSIMAVAIAVGVQGCGGGGSSSGGTTSTPLTTYNSPSTGDVTPLVAPPTSGGQDQTGSTSITNIMVIGEPIDVSTPSSNGTISIKHGFDLSVLSEVPGPSASN